MQLNANEHAYMMDGRAWPTLSAWMTENDVGFKVISTSGLVCAFVVTSNTEWFSLKVTVVPAWFDAEPSQ